MSKLTYEELEAENERLRAKLSGGADEEFTKFVKEKLPTKSALFNRGFIKGERITIRPAELWMLMVPNIEAPPPSTRKLAELGKSLEALGWARSARRGNLVFTLPVAEYAR